MTIARGHEWIWIVPLLLLLTALGARLLNHDLLFVDEYYSVFLTGGGPYGPVGPGIIYKRGGFFGYGGGVGGAGRRDALRGAVFFADDRRAGGGLHLSHGPRPAFAPRRTVRGGCRGRGGLLPRLLAG